MDSTAAVPAVEDVPWQGDRFARCHRPLRTGGIRISGIHRWDHLEFRRPWSVAPPQLGFPVMSRFGLVIFDCDGVLVDSERLIVRTEVEILASLGWPLSQSDIVDRFVGRSARYMQEQIEFQIGRPVDWEQEFEQRYRNVLETELEPVDGVAEALTAITVPICVASSGSHQEMQFTLGRTGLIDRFGGNIFSADEVEQGKPAPDLFLHAAQRMGVPSERCAVVEDSIAAGMSVFAFAGGVTSAARLERPGVVVFDQMRFLPGLLDMIGGGPPVD